MASPTAQIRFHPIRSFLCRSKGQITAFGPRRLYGMAMDFQFTRIAMKRMDSTLGTFTSDKWPFSPLWPDADILGLKSETAYNIEGPEIDGGISNRVFDRFADIQHPKSKSGYFTADRCREVCIANLSSAKLVNVDGSDHGTSIQSIGAAQSRNGVAAERRMSITIDSLEEFTILKDPEDLPETKSRRRLSWHIPKPPSQNKLQGPVLPTHTGSTRGWQVYGQY
ncbi:hypothetical protein K490DRAFT_56080 [Saccharata proteae CBS 121410]|uniref:Uncharacterized protein n=1 Tax=Saccharata proteae CBS 121410 TaxID=1314787 RepID=A0A9P4M1A6_9PEZI|nr:hypothetical protein K490DRAFT_56080 [Saccharata proteae CBS 121410]